MSLRDELSDLIGAEVQAHPITLNGKTKTLYFRQIMDAEGREVFRPIEGESDDERGRRIMRALVRASACDANGEPNTTDEEVARFGSVVLQALFAAAAKTNNITFSTNADSDTAEGESPKA